MLLLETKQKTSTRQKHCTVAQDKWLRSEVLPFILSLCSLVRFVRSCLFVRSFGCSFGCSFGFSFGRSFVHPFFGLYNRTTQRVSDDSAGKKSFLTQVANPVNSTSMTARNCNRIEWLAASGWFCKPYERATTLCAQIPECQKTSIQ